MEAESIDKKNDIWLINIPILSIGRLISGMLHFGSELVKDKCHHPMNVKRLLWTYPKCKKESCPIRVKA